jgi:hypothetical protein
MVAFEHLIMSAEIERCPSKIVHLRGGRSDQWWHVAMIDSYCTGRRDIQSVPMSPRPGNGHLQARAA